MQSACAILYSHLWPVLLYLIFPHYLINGTIFLGEKKTGIEHKMCVLSFCTTFFLKNFSLFISRLEQDMIKNILVFFSSNAISKFVTQYFSDDQIEKNWMGGTCSTYGERRCVYRVFMGKPEGKRLCGRTRHIWEDNIKMDHQELGCGRMEWIELAQDKDRWREFGNTAMNLRVP
jgi:hypothetical protein